MIKETYRGRFYGLILTLILTLAIRVPAAAQETEKPINPLTGLTIERPELLSLPPALVPIAKYPDKYRPNAGLTSAAWVFEFYDQGGISRPFALYYGEIPAAASEEESWLGPIAGALYGVEDLRNHYGAVLISAGNRAGVAADGLYNVQYWYGESGKDLFPKLPLAIFERYLNDWKPKIQAPDASLLALPFSYGPPGAGLPAASLRVRYAETNQVVWEYDPATGLYNRAQNAISNQEILPDLDVLTGRQVSAQNVVLLFHDTETRGDGFKPVLNYVKSRPAIIFRDGIRYDVSWTTISGDSERATTRFRPIRFEFADGTPFPLKPGQTWVHLVRVGNDLSEVESPAASAERSGSGHWFLPYIEAKR